MELIKLTKIDNAVILVMDDHIYQRVLTKEDEGVYEEVESYVDQLKSGTLTAKEYALTKNYLRAIINTRPTPEYKEQMEREERISHETVELAQGAYNVQERLDRAERITSVNENLEHDLAGLVYLKGHSVPMPQDLVSAFQDATYNPESKYSVEALENFWKWAVLNPNPEARNDLFGWFQTGAFTITDEGMVVAYRCVNVKQRGSEDSQLWDFVNSSWVKVRAWKKSPKNYQIYRDKNDFYCHEYHVTNTKGDLQGNLDELYDSLSGRSFGNFGGETIYTDAHTGTFDIKLGEEVSMPREDCDQNRNASCSAGLHFMSKKYSLRLGDVRIIVLVNPMNIVAFPSYDQTKGRTCRYMPVALADLDDRGDVKQYDAGTLSFRYAGLEKERIENLAFQKGFEGMVKEGLINGEVSFTDFNFVREQAMETIKSKVRNVE